MVFRTLDLLTLTGSARALLMKTLRSKSSTRSGSTPTGISLSHSSVKAYFSCGSSSKSTDTGGDLKDRLFIESRDELVLSELQYFKSLFSLFRPHSDLI